MLVVVLLIYQQLHLYIVPLHSTKYNLEFDSCTCLNSILWCQVTSHTLDLQCPREEVI